MTTRLPLKIRPLMDAAANLYIKDNIRPLMEKK